ncbi:ParB/RepB/Spo0J family partition protein [Glutamicibacter ardleyensis]|uniref:ParB-like N-terminal domain-containing protein n=1 Tax=Glutamicibacter ardleyensis TaxID=225894 RepID=A0ABQ2DW78_9MICC|nr:ParB N-terminal domain-containing protein [Glutamicibacter ardleyensis]GGJ74527.1 hypothetical protein GCM10007173_36900 [Glutamicibacter ardleyensis]
MAKFDATLKVLALSSVHQHPDNIRDDLGDLTQLASEIKSMGVMSPLLVYPHPDRAGDFVVQDGNRRRAAAAEAGLTEVPCVVFPAPTAERGPRADIETMLSTGRNHRPLSEHEVSKGIQGLLDLGMDITTVGKKFKMSRKEVQARAKVARQDDGVSKAFSAGRLGLDAVQRLQELEDSSEDPTLYERTVSRIENLAHGASVENVERTIAEVEREVAKEKVRADLDELGAEQAPDDASYSSKWDRINSENELSYDGHIEAGHVWRMEYYATEPTWYAKAAKEKQELSEAEKLDKQVQAKLNGMLAIVARQRVAYIVDAVQNKKADEDFAKKVMVEQIMFASRYEDTPQMLLGKIVSNEYPTEQDFDSRESWRENVGKFLARWPLAKLALVLKLVSSSQTEEKLAKLKGFERTSYERDGFHGGWNGVREYYELLADQLGYELDIDEVEAMQYSAKAEPKRNREMDLVENPDEVTATCQECSQEVVADSEWAGFCVNCIDDAAVSE